MTCVDMVIGCDWVSCGLGSLIAVPKCGSLHQAVLRRVVLLITGVRTTGISTLDVMKRVARLAARR
jgi:hypothetical protein